MTREEALMRLYKRGIEGKDAETALDAATENFGGDIDLALRESAFYNTTGLIRWFGQDGARVIQVLRQSS